MSCPTAVSLFAREAREEHRAHVDVEKTVDTEAGGVEVLTLRAVVVVRGEEVKELVSVRTTVCGAPVEVEVTVVPKMLVIRRVTLRAAHQLGQRDARAMRQHGPARRRADANRRRIA
jgi:hypothetical protein